MNCDAYEVLCNSIIIAVVSHCQQSTGLVHRGCACNEDEAEHEVARRNKCWRQWLLWRLLGDIELSAPDNFMTFLMIHSCREPKSNSAEIGAVRKCDASATWTIVAWFSAEQKMANNPAFQCQSQPIHTFALQTNVLDLHEEFVLLKREAFHWQ